MWCYHALRIANTMMEDLLISLSFPAKGEPGKIFLSKWLIYVLNFISLLCEYCACDVWLGVVFSSLGLMVVVYWIPALYFSLFCFVSLLWDSWWSSSQPHGIVAKGLISFLELKKVIYTNTQHCGSHAMKFFTIDCWWRTLQSCRNYWGWVNLIGCHYKNNYSTSTY